MVENINIVTDQKLINSNVFENSHHTYITTAQIKTSGKEEVKVPDEFVLVNKELITRFYETEKQVAELIIANKELLFQNEEREKFLAELIIANKDLMAFNYVSSHDLQEPLRKIQNFVAIILEEDEKHLSRDGKAYFHKMKETAKRMEGLIEDLLSYSRSKNSEGNFQKTNFSVILNEVEKDFDELILEKKATISLIKSCHIKVIPFQFRQLLSNLVSNSLKFVKPGEFPRISIECKIVKKHQLNTGIPIHFNSQKNNYKSNSITLATKKKYCHIVYKDNGIGFDPKFNEQIFEVFYRLHTYEEFKGTGIGLAICKRIVENHGGLITAFGDLNKGAKFDIYIPIQE